MRHQHHLSSTFCTDSFIHGFSKHAICPVCLAWQSLQLRFFLAHPYYALQDCFSISCLSPNSQTQNIRIENGCYLAVYEGKAEQNHLHHLQRSRQCLLHHSDSRRATHLPTSPRSCRSATSRRGSDQKNSFQKCARTHWAGSKAGPRAEQEWTCHKLETCSRPQRLSSVRTNWWQKHNRESKQKPILCSGELDGISTLLALVIGRPWTIWNLG